MLSSAYCEGADVVGLAASSQTGWTKAPLPAESQIANRTHFLPAASNGRAKRLVPSGVKSVSEMI